VRTDVSIYRTLVANCTTRTMSKTRRRTDSHAFSLCHLGRIGKSMIKRSISRMEYADILSWIAPRSYVLIAEQSATVELDFYETFES
jgi:hypothetical protein